MQVANTGTQYCTVADPIRFPLPQNEMFRVMPWIATRSPSLTQG